jgi:hypothetical protein
MPLVRGRLLPEVELSGRAKLLLDVLLWTEELGAKDLRSLEELEILRIYLRSVYPVVCDIRLWVPSHHYKTISLLSVRRIEFSSMNPVKADQKVQEKVSNSPPELADAVCSALAVDADCLVVNNLEWLPFIEDVEKLFVFLTDYSFLLPYSEIFVRGHDVPWAFGYQSWGLTWTAFYQLAERRTFALPLDLLHQAYQKKAPSDAQETGRSLVYNRLGNLCFTRDRLHFFEIQRLASGRSGWKRQKFAFEIAYYLNFNYLLIYGAFDHAALFVSQLLKLGLPPRQVGATYKGFLDLLKSKSASLYSVFTTGTNKEFIDRIGALRHFAAHRGSLMPTNVVKALDREPTPEELDADIRAQGLEEILLMLPSGKAREGYREMLRTNARMARYEKETLLEDVVLIELDGKHGFIRPHSDTAWNFEQLMAFLTDVLKNCYPLL